MSGSPNKRDQILEIIKNRIYAGHYWPREQLVETAIAEEMGVSRTVIRDVFKELLAGGLVTTQPHKGTFVAQLAYQKLKEILELEAILEGSAAYLGTNLIKTEQIDELYVLIENSKKLEGKDIQAWINYNWHFHKVIISACGNRHLIKLIKKNVQFVKYWFVQFLIPEEINYRNASHEDILKAIRERDSNLVRELMEKHLLFAAEDLMPRMCSLNPHFINSEKKEFN